MTSQGKVKLQVWLLIVVVFALGAVTGGSLDRLYLANNNSLKPATPGHGPRGLERIIGKLKGELNLSDEQVPKIRTIFEESRKEFPQSRFAECPGFKESRARTRSRVRELLTPEQQKKYDAINAQRDAEVSKDR
ncbi:MAG: Spy/CpxP family protein refolding chaperone [Blastocatellales bacterium]